MRESTSDGKGRGVFATRYIAEGEVIFCESPLAAMQHLASSENILCCARCFRYLELDEPQRLDFPMQS